MLPVFVRGNDSTPTLLLLSLLQFLWLQLPGLSLVQAQYFLGVPFHQGQNALGIAGPCQCRGLNDYRPIMENQMEEKQKDDCMELALYVVYRGCGA